MSKFDKAMQGFNFGVNAVRQYQDAKLESDVGEAYKNTGQTTATDSEFGNVQMEGLYNGPGNDGVMTNAQAASYGLMQPTSSKTNYTLGGKTQGTSFTEGQIEAARTRASADVYANAGRMREASGLRRDAATLTQTELATEEMQRNRDQDTAMDKMIAGMPQVGSFLTPGGNGKSFDPAAKQAELEAGGMSPEDAKAASTQGLVKATAADQSSYLASVYLAGGHKKLPLYQAAIKDAAQQRSDQVRRDINASTDMAGLFAAYGHIDDGKSFRQVPELGPDGAQTGRFTVEQFDQKTDKAVGKFQGGKTYENFDQLKAGVNVMMNLNPDAFVAHEQAQATRLMEQNKFTEEKRKNKAVEGLHSESNATANRVAASGEVNATTAAAAQSSQAGVNKSMNSLHAVQTATAQQGLDLTQALGTEESKRTPAQKILVDAQTAKYTLDQNKPENLVKLRKGAEATINSYIVGGKTFTTPYMKDEVEKGATLRRVSGTVMKGMTAAELESSSILDLSQEVIKRAGALKDAGDKRPLEEVALEVLRTSKPSTTPAPVPAAAAGLNSAAPAAAAKPATNGRSPGYGALWN